MTQKMLIFDFRNSEKNFFEENDLGDFDIETMTEPLNGTTVNELPQDTLENTTILSVFITSRVTKEVIDKFSNLRIIAARSTGVNHIDIEECNKRNIAVVNVENYGSTTVVQFAWGLILNLVRNIFAASQDIKEFSPQKNDYVGRDLKNLTIGVIGTGAIGSGMCKIANTFEMNILAYDKRKNSKLEDLYGVKYVDLQELLRASDVVTLHLPLCHDNYHLIGKSQFEIMKSSAILINTARGELVNTDDLFNALENNEVKGAALDVVECEDITFHGDNLLEIVERTGIDCLAKSIIVQKLAAMPNVIITPHIAYDTQDAVELILKTTFANIRANWQGERLNQIN